ncbi:estrogen sulfotransferase-like isoform X2 [Zootermopsis nevadensis]|uniref:Estrogen sulfotransferase n=2 Tax=Zootermopsis nevadensis TaxID=136037 RepID=A0A067RGU6_ZOONE|nr:estrogen sulfotransferase-like isoform X2 [Zootermopsis nevadensis]XP_021942477.1 estrogen sulfotransferase-like isoform X2 [Zootermopsis nevadensis]XP_021942478.1 estrogen sulfotransferase-like isoform X2 [Zootermopsis nevadensis]KDR22997.1 Estrogen sulfotransferase [Zootermopsis nevadensis]
MDDFQFEVLQGPLVDKFKTANQTFHSDGVIRMWPPGCAMFAEYRNHADRVRHLTVRKDDVWILTYPKSGTTWTQEMAWLLINNLDYETARKIPQTERSPYLELGCLVDEDTRRKANIADSVRAVEMLQSPRCIKSHLPLQLLPKQLWTVRPKIIYVARDVKDVAASYYHHYRLFFGYTGSCEDFVEAFLAEIVPYGSVWDHILDFWNIRHESNVMFNTFEEMKKDLPRVVQRTADFLDCTLTSEQMKRLCEHLSFESMKENRSVSHEDEMAKLRGKETNLVGKIEPFMRKGEVGGWKNDVTPQLEERLNVYTEGKLAGVGYELKYQE